MMTNDDAIRILLGPSSREQLSELLNELVVAEEEGRLLYFRTMRFDDKSMFQAKYTSVKRS